MTTILIAVFPPILLAWLLFFLLSRILPFLFYKRVLIIRERRTNYYSKMFIIKLTTLMTFVTFSLWLPIYHIVFSFMALRSETMYESYDASILMGDLIESFYLSFLITLLGVSIVYVIFFILEISSISTKYFKQKS